MEFTTPVSVAKSRFDIGYSDKIIFLGSCFTENIGNWLQDSFMNVNINPFGIIYNPSTVANSLRNIMSKKQYSETDLFCNAGLYRSFDFHSRYSDKEPLPTISLMNRSISDAYHFLKTSDYLIITFGTSWIYEKEAQIVANCHKLSEKTFERRRLSVDEIVEEWDDLIILLKHFNPNLKIIFTVSPIRHIKDTLHGNQLSKSVLLLAIDEIIKRYQDFTEYFPSYEILMDELRDYRFYAEDMVHPSQTAISYIREKFSGCYFTEETKRDINFCSKINMALSHRPSDPGSAAYKNFLEQNIRQIKNYIEKNNIPQLESAIEGFDKKLRKL